MGSTINLFTFKERKKPELEKIKTGGLQWYQ